MRLKSGTKNCCRMDKFLAWLELAEWQQQARAKLERSKWCERYGLASLKQCDYICQLYESAPMPAMYNIIYARALARRLPLYEFEIAALEMKEILNFNQPDPRQQIKRLFAAGTMF